MINLTNGIIVVAVSDLNQQISRAIAETRIHLEQRFGVEPVKAVWSLPERTFQWVFSESETGSAPNLDGQFLNALLEYANTDTRNSQASRVAKDIRAYFPRFQPSATAIKKLSSCFKTVLIRLWNNGAILLPNNFLLHNTKFSLPPIDKEKEFYHFVQSYSRDRENSKVLPHQMARRFVYCDRIAFATDWRTIEDLSIYEMADLHRASRVHADGPETDSNNRLRVSAAPIPWTTVLTEVLRVFGMRVSFTEEQLQCYRRWLNGHWASLHSFRDFEVNEIELVKERHAKAQLQAQVRFKEQAPGRRNVAKTHLGQIKPPTALYEPENVLSPGVNVFKTSAHDDILTWFGAFRTNYRENFNWLEESCAYVGREHIDVKELSKKWIIVFRAFMRFRKNSQGFEESKGVASSLALLADYLFLYLPWWIETHPDTKLVFPTAPKDFSRYQFVSRSEELGIDRAPLTLFEIARVRRRTEDARYVFIKHMQLFFLFITSHYEEDDGVAGSDFKSPIIGEFDLPRVKKRTKTSKIPFHKSVYGFLLYYGYAVEAFGEHLQRLALSSDLSTGKRERITAPWLETEAFGFVPIVHYRDYVIPLKVVPNIFTWGNREINIDGKRQAVFLPHLTNLRLLQGAVEMGLRVQSIQWLDRLTWDSRNLGLQGNSEFSYEPDGQYTYELLVNTDKTKEQPWITLMVHRVRSLFLREEKFQSHFCPANQATAIPYEGRENSRFDPIVPLFRSPKGWGPVSDSSYDSAWIKHLLGFERFFSSIPGNESVRFLRFSRIKTPDGSIKIASTPDGNLFCPMVLHAINTPHACRATFASNRQGLLELSDIAELLGHLDPVVTQYYQAFNSEDLAAKLEASDRIATSHANIFDPNGPAFIRADKSDSTLVRTFSSNRAEAIHLFKFMPALALWSLEDLDGTGEEGLDLLREGPMSQIRFRETHICPVGEECPSEIVIKIGAPKKCGMCPLAMKCVDHLPAIGAKKNELLEKIRFQIQHRRRMEKRSEPTATIDALWEQTELDTNELLGWVASEEVLHAMLREEASDGFDSKYYATEPEIVRRQLASVSVNAPHGAFLLQRLAEANAYPSMETPAVTAFAAKLRRSILAGQNPITATPTEAMSDVEAAAGLLRTLMAAHGLSFEEIANAVSDGLSISARQFSLSAEE